MAHPCNDFVIKEGKFIRDFEKMYQQCDDPWDQRKVHQHSLMNNMALWMLSNVIGNHIETILDVGCAEGYYASTVLSMTHNKNAQYTGTDISPTVIERARKNIPLDKKKQIRFITDDIRIPNQSFINTYHLLFATKILYYVAPEIDTTLGNIESYLTSQGLFCFTYNAKRDAFSNQWLTYEQLRTKILERNFTEKIFAEIGRFSEETSVIGIYQKK
jgi:predicted TPR repeat methyltransferase